MDYQCSQCRAHMGAMLDKDGKPELFKCPKSNRAAHMIPELPVCRETPTMPREIE